MFCKAILGELVCCFSFQGLPWISGESKLGFHSRWSSYPCFFLPATRPWNLEGQGTSACFVREQDFYVNITCFQGPMLATWNSPLEGETFKSKQRPDRGTEVRAWQPSCRDGCLHGQKGPSHLGQRDHEGTSRTLEGKLCLFRFAAGLKNSHECFFWSPEPDLCVANDLRTIFYWL